MTTDPLEPVTLPRRDRDRPTSIPVADLPALRAAIHEAGPVDLVELFDVLAVTGLRPGEALALRWRDVDLDARDKTGAAVTVIHVCGTTVEKGGIRRQPIPKTKAGHRRLTVLSSSPAGVTLRAPVLSP